MAIDKNTAPFRQRDVLPSDGVGNGAVYLEMIHIFIYEGDEMWDLQCDCEQSPAWVGIDPL